MYIMIYFSTTKLLFLVLPYNYKSTYTILYYATVNSDDTSMGFQIQSTATSFFAHSEPYQYPRAKGGPFRSSDGENNHMYKTLTKIQLLAVYLSYLKKMLGNGMGITGNTYHSQVHSIYNFA